jgi:hypothetical protein
MAHRLEVPPLDRAAELLAQLMRPQFDDRIVGHPLDRPIGAIERDGDLRRLGEQGREFLLESVDMPIHGNPP